MVHQEFQNTIHLPALVKISSPSPKFQSSHFDPIRRYFGYLDVILAKKKGEIDKGDVTSKIGRDFADSRRDIDVMTVSNLPPAN